MTGLPSRMEIADFDQVLPNQPHFLNQQDKVNVFWGYGLFPDKEVSPRYKAEHNIDVLFTSITTLFH
jgi:hypothetical protein